MTIIRLNGEVSGGVQVTNTDDLTTLSLTDLTDVSVGGATAGQVLKYNGSVWQADTDLDSTPALGDLTDVDLTGVADGEVLAYNQGTGNWEPTLVGGAVDSVNSQTGVVLLDTDDVPEGLANLYYTDARADARVAAGIAAIDYPVDSVNGQTNTVVLDTDDITEGTTNLYYTDARAQAVSINELIEDTTPQLGGDLDPNGFNIVGTGAMNLSAPSNSHQFVRATSNDSNPVMVVAKDNTDLSLKAGVLFRALNTSTSSQYSIAAVNGERLANSTSNTTPRQLLFSLYNDNGSSRGDVLALIRNYSGTTPVDTVNVLKSMSTLGITAVGEVNITGNLIQSGLSVNLTSTGFGSTGVNLNSETTVNLTAVENINVDAAKIISNAGYETTVDSTGATNREPMLMKVLLPNNTSAYKDLANAMSAFIDYGLDDLPLQTQMTFKFGVRNDARGDLITGRLVSTYNETAQLAKMEMRAYEPDHPTNTDTHHDIGVNKNYSYSTVPFKYPNISLTTYAGVSEAGMVLFDTDDNTLKCYDGTAWQAMF